MEFQNLGAVNYNLGPADRLALCPCPVQASLDALRQPNTLLLGDGSQDRQHSIPERPDTAEILFLKRPPINSVPGEPLKMLEGLQDALPGKTVERRA